MIFDDEHHDVLEKARIDDHVGPSARLRVRREQLIVKRKRWNHRLPLHRDGKSSMICCRRWMMIWIWPLPRDFGDQIYEYAPTATWFCRI